MNDIHTSFLRPCLHNFTTLADCGNVYQLADGHVNFTGAVTTYGHKIAVTCKEGYGIVGDSHISCLANGTWSTNTLCQIRGQYSNWM